MSELRFIRLKDCRITTFQKFKTFGKFATNKPDWFYPYTNTTLTKFKTLSKLKEETNNPEDCVTAKRSKVF